jgi:hypothetical protein
MSSPSSSCTKGRSFAGYALMKGELPIRDALPEPSESSRGAFGLSLLFCHLIIYKAKHCRWDFERWFMIHRKSIPYPTPRYPCLALKYHYFTILLLWISLL